MRAPTVSVVKKMFDGEMGYVTELVADVGSDDEMEIGKLPLKRQLYSYVCFEKAQTDGERTAWTDSVISAMIGNGCL